MGTCFVMQPFDRGPYDKRYEDVFAPAIRDADLEPYRVDQDVSVSIPISKIEYAIKASDICFAEITTDNPNVWFELGYAIASQKQVVLVCSYDRKERFPFDVQHRTIIRYSTESSSDFDKLKAEITFLLSGLMKNEMELGKIVVSGPMVDIEGLTQIEIGTLVSIGGNVEYFGDTISTYLIKQDMERVGFLKMAANLGVDSLLRKGMITGEEDIDEKGYKYFTWKLTRSGIDWLIHNQNKLKLHSAPKPPNSATTSPDDDIPF